MTQPNVALAADYADSLILLRRAKVVLFLLVLFVLLTQIILFFAMRYGYPHLLENPALLNPSEKNHRDAIEYLVGLLNYGGTILPVLMTVILFITLQIQLVGRLVGTAAMTMALLGGLVLTIMLFPWQAVINSPGAPGDPLAAAVGLKLPGVVFTWAEFSHGDASAIFKADRWDISLLHWSRYLVFPIISVLLLIWVQYKSDWSFKKSIIQELTAAETNTPL